MEEEWRAIDGYKWYEVSSYGRVRNTINDRILKGTIKATIAPGTDNGKVLRLKGMGMPKFDKAEERAIGAAAERYGVFLGLPVAVE